MTTTKPAKTRRKRRRYSGRKNWFECGGVIVYAPARECECCGEKADFLCVLDRWSIKREYGCAPDRNKLIDTVKVCRECSFTLEVKDVTVPHDWHRFHKTSNDNIVFWMCGYRSVAFKAPGGFKFLVDDLGDLIYCNDLHERIFDAVTAAQDGLIEILEEGEGE